MQALKKLAIDFFLDGELRRKEKEIAQKLDWLYDRIDELEKLAKHREEISETVLDHGRVVLKDWMGDDLRIVNAARQSFNKESIEFGDDEKGLIKFLMRNRHGTPFETVVFTFNVKAPIFVAREWFRHRIASYNEQSGRYSELGNEFYIPREVNIRGQVGRPGNYHFEPLQHNAASVARNHLMQSADVAWHSYETALNMGVAKELARLHLPVNIYTNFTWVINLRSLFNFINLRSASNAQWEIQQYSKTIEPMVKHVAPIAWEAFLKNERVAP